VTETPNAEARPFHPKGWKAGRLDSPLIATARPLTPAGARNLPHVGRSAALGEPQQPLTSDGPPFSVTCAGGSLSVTCAGGSLSRGTRNNEVPTSRQPNKHFSSAEAQISFAQGKTGRADTVSVGPSWLLQLLNPSFCHGFVGVRIVHNS